MSPRSEYRSGYTRSESADARSAYGVLGVDGSSQIHDFGTGVASGFTASAGFSDIATFGIANTFVSGLSGSIGFVFSTDGVNSVSGSGDFATTASDGQFIHTSLDALSPHSDVAYPIANGQSSFIVWLPFTAADVTRAEGPIYWFDIPVSLSLSTAGGCGTNGFAVCTLSSDFFDTALVTGVLLEDSSGNLISTNISFASGTDYDALSGDQSRVPEPPSWTLITMGATLIVFRCAIKSRDKSLCRATNHKMFWVSR
jgi:hypothetical protein